MKEFFKSIDVSECAAVAIIVGMSIVAVRAIFGG